MPPPPSQIDPRSPRPYLAQTNSLDAAAATSLGNVHPRQQLDDISRRLRDSRERRNAARDAAAGFRQRLRQFNASRTGLNLPLPPLNMVDHPQALRQDGMLQRFEEQNRARLARLRAHQPLETPEFRPAGSIRTLPRTLRRSYSQLRPSQVDNDTSDTQRNTTNPNQLAPTSRRRRAYMPDDRQNSPFHVGSDMITTSSDTITDLDSDEPQVSRPQVKRRKISHSSADIFEGYNPIKYGWHGQVDPGHLRLEIVSCDGGQYDQQLKYRAENLLRNDPSVYCSNSSTCSLLLRHQAETSFNLEALIIKGPEAGYTHPVQQGLVFVGMSVDELLQSSAAYQMIYSDVTCPKRVFDERELSDLMEDHSVYVNSQTRGSNRFWENIAGSAQYQSFFGENLECDWPNLNGTLTGNPMMTAPTPPYSEQMPLLADFSDTEQPTGERAARGPARTTIHNYGTHTVISSGHGRPPPPPPAGSSGAYDDEDNDSELGDYSLYDFPEINENQYSLAPGRIEKVVPPLKKESEILTPSATFFTRRYQNRISVRFDPPLAGRYILVKLFNPHDPKGNIDVQYVAAYGYSGPRFMPAIQLR